MFKFLLSLILLLLFKIKDIDGCIPMRIIDPITFPVTTTLSPPSNECSTEMNEAAIYIENGVNLADSEEFLKTMPTRTCMNSANGIVTYYNGVTPVNYGTALRNMERVWVGMWLRGNCANPCVCTSTACYTPVPGNPNENPNLYLYPHCISPNDCFIALIFITTGTIVNPLNPADMFSVTAQDAAGSDVTDPSYPRITRIGCSSCPLMM